MGSCGPGFKPQCCYLLAVWPGSQSAKWGSSRPLRKDEEGNYRVERRHAASAWSFPRQPPSLWQNPPLAAEPSQTLL